MNNPHRLGSYHCSANLHQLSLHGFLLFIKYPLWVVFIRQTPKILLTPLFSFGLTHLVNRSVEHKNDLGLGACRASTHYQVDSLEHLTSFISFIRIIKRTRACDPVCLFTLKFLHVKLTYCSVKLLELFLI